MKFLVRGTAYDLPLRAHNQRHLDNQEAYIVMFIE